MANGSRTAALLVPALLFASTALAQDDTQELAKKLSNPIAGTKLMKHTSSIAHRTIKEYGKC
ncbi:MAG TPA: hypothetical protein VGX71_15055 [Pseudaminobacter sp.]|jgi:hypothetical protein|nr:hypothetical protein [Pseudaminobacter sp.]